jgi:hypothetical protein
MDTSGKSNKTSRYRRDIRRCCAFESNPSLTNGRLIPNLSLGTNIEGPVMKFVTLGGNPSQVANDDAIRKLVRSNASRSTRRGGEGLQSNISPPNPILVPASQSSLASGKSRFALASRKPLKRVRYRQAPSKSGGRLKVGHPNAQIPPPDPTGGQDGILELIVSNDSQRLLLGYPGSMLIQPTYSSTYMAVKTKSKVSTMTQQC